VQNVPYFKDKGDSNSSAGWKVSVAKFFSQFIYCSTNDHHCLVCDVINVCVGVAGVESNTK
jgi:hypothetical protein